MPRSGTGRACFAAKWMNIRGARPAALLAALAALTSTSGDVFAQGSRTPTPPRATRVSYSPEQTKTIIDDLSNMGLMNDFSRRRFPGDYDLPGAGAPTATTPTAEIRKLKTLIREFADEVSQLGYELNDEVRRVPSLRPMLTDALSISAMAVSLDRSLDRINDHRLVVNEVRDLDAKWRELAYRLGNVPSLSRATRDRIASLNLINEDIDKAIGINPQINRRDLWEKTYDLAQDLRNLIEDVQMELGSRQAQQFLLALSRARQQIMNIASMLEEPTIDVELVKNEYKQFQAIWYPERVKLQSFNNGYLERSLRRITQTDGEIHQLLLLPTKVDSQQLIYLTSALKKDIDDFFDRTSLKLLMHLPRADRVAGVSSEFYGVCEHFVDEVRSNARREDLIDSFRYIEDARRSFLDVFYDIQSDEALAALHRIDQTIESLSASLQISRDDFDRQGAIDQAAIVETNIDQLEWVAKRWLSRDRQPFANACLQAIAQMRQQTTQLNQDLVRGASTPQLRRQAETLYDTWRTVYNYLVQCQTDDRPNLGRLSSRITPALVELRTMLTH